jgi:polysaccharide export outer membrane protein
VIDVWGENRSSQSLIHQCLDGAKRLIEAEYIHPDRSDPDPPARLRMSWRSGHERHLLPLAATRDGSLSGDILAELHMMKERARITGVTGHRPSVVAIAIVAFSVACSFAACGSSAGSIHIDQLPDQPTAASAELQYTIGVGDLLNIQVYNDEKASTRTRVRSDGRISLTFVNDIEAVGKTPVNLAREIETALKTVIVSPSVTISIEESRPLNISVLGEVSKPGLQTLDRNAGVAQALASAGGLSPFAHKDRIFVVRNDPSPMRIRFSYEALTRNIGKGHLFRLQAGDVVVVE